MFLLLPNAVSDISHCSLLPCAQPFLALPVTPEAAQLLFMKKFSSFFIVPQPFLEGEFTSFFTFSFARDLPLTWACCSNNAFESADSSLFPEAEVQGWGVWESSH